VESWNITLVQMQATPRREENLQRAALALAEAARDSQLVVLPELFSCSYQVADWPAAAESVPDGPTCAFLRDQARQHGIHLAGGSLPELRQGRVYNTATLWSPQGELLARHRKAHLFDVDIPDGITFFESEFFAAGDEVTVVDTPLGKLGLAICFDVRFPELFRVMALRGAEAVLLPAAFNTTTGPAHWDLQLRCRAVENTIYLAGCSTAPHPEVEYPSWGHSAWVDPFGEILQQADRDAALVRGRFDRARLRQVRAALPFLQARRPDVYGRAWLEA